jgi:hypothetical protein
MIFIHIGVSKAGSATIQTFLDTHESALRDLSVDYPRLGRLDRNAHHNFANELKGRADKFSAISGNVSQLADYLRDTPYRTTVLSSEGFWTCSAQAVRRFAASLAGVNAPIRIILVIRDRVDIAPSTYAQEVRYGIRTFDFDRFFEQKQARDYFNAFEAANRWADAFGWEALIVRVLDPALLVGGDLITDFLSQIGLDPASPLIRNLPRGPRVNVSPGWKTLEAVRALFDGGGGLDERHPLASLMAADLPDFRKKRIGWAAEVVGGELAWNLDRGRYLTMAQAQWLYDAHLKVLDALNARLQCDLPPPPSLEARGFVARDFMPDASHIPAAELKDFHDRLATEVETQAERILTAKRAMKKAAKAAGR